MVTFRFLFTCALFFTAVSCAGLKQNTEPALALKDILPNSEATVLFWWANECPCVSRYQSRIENLNEEYSHQGISFLAVSSNSNDDQETNAKVAKRRSFGLPIIKDHGGHLAQQLNVKTTPTVVLIDKNGSVKYRGWIDNERLIGEEGRIAYLENAIKDLLASKDISKTSSPTYGCRVTKSLL